MNHLRTRRRQRLLLLFILLAAGAAARLLHITSPIHELSHVIIANIVGGGGKLSGWTEATVWAEYGDHRAIRYAGAFGEMIVYLTLSTLLHIWKMRPGGAFWHSVGTASYFNTHLLDDFYIPWGVEDPETTMALLVFHVVFGVLLLVGWVLFVGREYQYQTEVLPYLQREPKRMFLEKIRRRWG